MGDCRPWDELIPDALGVIFSKLSLQDKLTIIPLVCKSWGRAVAGPYCWQEIDIEEWSQRSKPEQLDGMLRLLIGRSCGSFRRLSVSRLPSDAMFSFVAEQAEIYPSTTVSEAKLQPFDQLAWIGGDPLYDVIPIYLDVFRGDVRLLKQFLQRYGLPLQRTCHDGPSSGQLENEKDFKRLSYRAMCYCILHEDNVLGAIFSLWKELKMAKTWEQVEEVVWGELNNYGACCFD